jgi:hypothetical protein
MLKKRREINYYYYYSPMTFMILSVRWVGNTGCPAKSSTKGLGVPQNRRRKVVTLLLVDMSAVILVKQVHTHSFKSGVSFSAVSGAKFVNYVMLH